jgi:hypothetical protein
MIKINDYATKNHLNEWEIKKLPDNKGEWKVDHKGDLFFWGNNVWGYYRLDLPNGDLSILFYLADIKQLNQSIFFIPSLPDNKTIIDNIDNLFYTGLGRGVCPTIYTLDNSLCTETGVVQNITPDWSEYIAKDNAVLFLSDEDADTYSNSYDDVNLVTYKNAVYHLEDENVFKKSGKTSIILPSIHSQNIQEISNIAKDLKENYGVEYVEIVATHCYLTNIPKKTLENFNKMKQDEFKVMCYDNLVNMSCKDSDTKHITREYCENFTRNSKEWKEREGGYEKYKNEKVSFIDKIITTDSTSILEPQKSERLEVIDCEEFFNEINL